MLYKEGYPTLVEKKIPTACIYTMNIEEKDMIEGGYRQNLEVWENFLTWYFKKPLIAYAFNTYQFDDYSKYDVNIFDPEHKKERLEKLKYCLKLGERCNNSRFVCSCNAFEGKRFLCHIYRHSFISDGINRDYCLF